jgi:hypothetical protein
MRFQDGLHVVVKKDCPTCILIEPAIRALAQSKTLRIYVQDDPSFLNDLADQQDETARYAKPTNVKTAPIGRLQAVATEADVVVAALSD